MKLLKRKKSLSLLLVFLLMAVMVLTGCADESAGNEEGVKKIGIIQIVEHPSLNTIREAIIAQLEQEGFKDGENIEIDYHSAQGDPSNLKTISQRFATGNYDLIIAIATPSAQAVVGETKEIPIIFSACTDPIGSGLVERLENPGGNVTGTSDAVSAEKIMSLAMQITPEIKTIGALYNGGETNSQAVIKELKSFASKHGLTVVEATVSNTAEVQQAALSLVSKVDAIFSPIDNTVASAMPVVADVARQAKLPVYVGADSMVKDGGLATYGINYEALGRETGKMAGQVLSGVDPGEISVLTIEDVQIYINQETAAQIGVEIPADILAEANLF
ncbi:MAG: ABC transporter substrate-binding protein [Firmicutes bacterium]|nr:ABC transporter substrate-binding protein [Bacillota bacterium]